MSNTNHSRHMNYEERLQYYREQIEIELAKYFTEPLPQAKLFEAMRYSLLGGGKRLRGVLVLEFCRVSGGDALSALPLACAVEMLHCYSLIHDDLPCMDDDDMRRGMPSNHIVFGEAMAMLAGDALQTGAFTAVLSSELSPEVRAESARLLANAAGAYGMCGGQLLDLASDTPDETSLSRTHELKTAALISASCEMGAVAGGADDDMRACTRVYARALGLAFQIRDDVLDFLSTPEQLGKMPGSDERAGRKTFFTLYGETRCAELVDELTQRASSAVKSGFADFEFLSELAENLALRIS